MTRSQRCTSSVFQTGMSSGRGLSGQSSTGTAFLLRLAGALHGLRVAAHSTTRVRLLACAALAVLVLQGKRVGAVLLLAGRGGGEHDEACAPDLRREGGTRAVAGLVHGRDRREELGDRL